jgi:hypothetical protein
MKLPLRLIMVGRPKGRSLKSLRDKVKSLTGKPATKTQGLNLGFWYDKCLIAVKWRDGSCCHTMSDAKIEADMEIMIANGLSPPADICQHLTSRSSNRSKAEHKYESFCKTTTCFLPPSGSFNPNLPVLYELPRVEAWKIAVFQTTFWEETLCVYVTEGEPSMHTTLGLTDAMLGHLAEVDTLDMSSELATAYASSEMALMCIKCAIELPFSQDFVEAMQELAKLAKSGKTDHSALSLACTCLYANDWYRARVTRYLNAVPIMLEKSTECDAHISYMDTFNMEKAVESRWTLQQTMTKLNDMVDDLAVVLEKAAPTFSAGFSDALVKFVYQFFEATVGDDSSMAGEPWVPEFSKALASLAVTLPLDETIPNIVSVLAEANYLNGPINELFETK